MIGAFEKFTVDKDTPVPLYYQLKTRISEMIDSGELLVGDMLPPENDLCMHLQVSRPTVRQAMNELVAEGRLVRQKGKGTFISQPKVDVRFLQRLESFNTQMAQKGLKPSTTVLSLRVIPGIQGVNEALHLPPEAQLIQLSRLRYGNGDPMVWVETHTPYERFPMLMEQDFETGSFYELLERLYHTRVVRVLREIEAVNANRREAELLDIEPGKAVCLVKSCAVTEEGLPVEYSVARYRGDRNKFSVELYR